jgi:hypothetical protein
MTRKGWSGVGGGPAGVPLRFRLVNERYVPRVLVQKGVPELISCARLMPIDRVSNWYHQVPIDRVLG